ncbi:MAG: hypothetical protein HUU15_00615 [Candidatus Brocadiae bacterium]|nr:hypothetical protein [Candidatus Brocadiia bacterium]
MAKLNVDELKKDMDAQKKAVAAIRTASKDRRKDVKLRESRKELKRLQRRWRLATGKKIAAQRKAAGGDEKKG